VRPPFGGGLTPPFLSHFEDEIKRPGVIIIFAPGDFSEPISNTSEDVSEKKFHFKS